MCRSSSSTARPDDLSADTIVLDNAGGVRQAVEHLLAHGHRRIGLVGDLSRLSTHRERIAAFQQAMQQAGVADPERLRAKRLPRRRGRCPLGA